jgi:hypothetical protein
VHFLKRFNQFSSLNEWQGSMILFTTNGMSSTIHTAWPVRNLTTNVPLWALKNISSRSPENMFYFSEVFEIQDDRLEHDWPTFKKFENSFITVTRLAKDVNLWVLKMCCYLLGRFKIQNMATLIFDWPKHLPLLFENNCIWSRRLARSASLVLLTKCCYIL